MPKFLTGNELNLELEKLFEKAKEQIIIISPFIKLHSRLASTLMTKKGNPKVQIIIVFGKNEDDPSKSMGPEDFNFLKDFPNIEIRYEQRLHAKYYANESSAILTSMNLYNYSQDNNIEAGILTNTTLLGVTSEDNFDRTAFNYFLRVVEQSKLLFKKFPEYENTILGLSKTYLSSKVEIDKLSSFYNNKDYEHRNENVRLISMDNPTNNDKLTESKIESIQISNTRCLSTTELSKELGLTIKDLFTKFEELKWIYKGNEDWELTTLGKNKGAFIKKGKYRNYIAWPSSIIKEL